MKSKIVLLLFIGYSIGGNAQEPLSIFKNLVGKTWSAEGTWGDETKFKQETFFEYSLDNTLVLAHSKGFTNQEQTKYGDRNHGIRKWNSEKGILEFWEFDVFGGLTKGTVEAKEKDIIYTYTYGDTKVTDYWEYVDDKTYNFIVGNYADGEWQQIYLKTQFVAQKQNN